MKPEQVRETIEETKNEGLQVTVKQLFNSCDAMVNLSSQSPVGNPALRRSLIKLWKKFQEEFTGLKEQQIEIFIRFGAEQTNDGAYRLRGEQMTPEFRAEVKLFEEMIIDLPGIQINYDTLEEAEIDLSPKHTLELSWLIIFE